MRIVITFTALVLFLFSLSAQSSNPDSYNLVSLEQLNLNRTAVKLTSSQKSHFPNAHTGFIWNSGDNNTAKWRPQGIAGIALTNRKFLAVSWYGREDKAYDNRGVRVSFADVTNMDSVKYRHVLLVDENYNTFKGMHAGGLVYRRGKLHVPDSRSGTQKIYVFSLDAIKSVPSADRDRFYNYAYILKRESSYNVPIKPSFMSYDWDRDQVLIGSYHNCTDPAGAHSDEPECLFNSKNRLAWYSIGNVNGSSLSCAPFFSEMQGAASAADPDSNYDVLWVSSSWGKSKSSHLHIANITRGGCYSGGTGMINYRAVTYPPGLEDIHVAATSSNIWMLTEFGPHEGKDNNRVVFAVKRDRLMP